MDIIQDFKGREYIGSCCGNSFIILDCRGLGISEEEKEDYAIDNISKHDVDSALFIDASQTCSVSMEIFERDGSESDACGNGVILISYLLNLDEGKIEMKNSIATIKGDGSNQSILINIEFSDTAIVGEEEHIMFVKVGGEPHMVYMISDNFYSFDLQKLGEDLQEKYPTGVNVDVVQCIDDRHCLIRTYERGVFDETKSCGTGSLSSFLAVSYFNDKMYVDPVEFKSDGGSHWVSRDDGMLKLETLKSSCDVRPLLSN